MGPRGGTEILWGGLQKWADPELLSQVNILLSNTDRNLLHPTKPNILWHHVDTDQRVAQGIANPEFIERIYKVVFVSNWQKEKYIREFNLPREKCTVLLNALDPLPWNERPASSKLRLIYTSTPWRGLEVLLAAFIKLGRSDIELDVYSSTVIYGVDFMKNAYLPLFNRCRSTPGVNYHGYAANKGVIRALQGSHLFTYPSIFAETSCLAAIEAGAAGCKIVTTDLGALPETCGGWAVYTDHNINGLVDRYAELLNSAIEDYWNNYGQLAEQSKYFNERYSWKIRGDEWNNLLREACGK